QPVRLHDLVRDERDLPGVSVYAIDGRIDLRLGGETFVVAADAVDRVREPYAAVRMDDGVVRRIEPPAVVAIGKHGDGAVVFITYDAASAMLARDLPSLEIERVAVAVAGR